MCQCIKGYEYNFDNDCVGLYFFCDCLTQMYEKQNVEYISSFFYIVSSLKFE